jgi:hypothetical protein
MKFVTTTAFSAVLIAALSAHSTAFANEDEAVRLCEQTISDTYNVDKFRNVWAEEKGNHKYKVHGNVKYQHDKHPFDCTVKRGHVKSYHYDGPHPGLADDADNDTAKKVLAIGAGLAIAAALAKAASDDGNDQTHMEDDCREALASRMREDHHDSADFTIKKSKLDGDILSGEGKVRWEHEQPNHVEFSCLFQDHRVDDTNYVLY